MPKSYTPKPRIEIVRSHDGYHLRIKSRNGKVLLWSEKYARERSAIAALVAAREIIGSEPQPVAHVDERKVPVAKGK